MSTSNNHFEREFRRQAGQLRRTPAARSWNRIEGRLDRRDRRGRLRQFRPWMIAAMVVLVAGVLLLTNSRMTPTERVLARQVQSVEELDAKIPAPASSPRPADWQPDYFPGQEQQRVGRLMVAKKYRVQT